VQPKSSFPLLAAKAGQNCQQKQLLKVALSALIQLQKAEALC
jgi:hypothetical protein